MLREETLKRFFQGEATTSDLPKDVAGSTKRLDSIASRIDIEDMDTELCVTRPMLSSLVDAVLNGSLPPDALGTLGFTLMASDKFVWDGDADDLPRQCHRRLVMPGSQLSPHPGECC